VWINDVLTIDADLDDARGQFAQRPGLTRKTGRIGLQQNQKADVEFRDVRIKDLSATAGNPDRAAAEWVLRVGGTGRVYVEETGVVADIGPTSPPPDKPFRLVGINLQGLPRVTNEALVHFLTGLRHVEEFRTEPDPSTGQRSLDFLGGWDRLKSLWVNLDARPSKATLATIAKGCPNLETLELVGYRPSNGLTELSNLKNLRNLFFFYSKFEADDFEQIKRIRSLDYVHFGKCGESEADAAALRAARPGLRVTRDP
jgi:hypothetical protein